MRRRFECSKVSEAHREKFECDTTTFFTCSKQCWHRCFVTKVSDSFSSPPFGAVLEFFGDESSRPIVSMGRGFIAAFTHIFNRSLGGRPRNCVNVASSVIAVEAEMLKTKERSGLKV